MLNAVLCWVQFLASSAKTLALTPTLTRAVLCRCTSYILPLNVAVTLTRTLTLLRGPYEACQAREAILGC